MKILSHLLAFIAGGLSMWLYFSDATPSTETPSATYSDDSVISPHNVLQYELFSDDGESRLITVMNNGTIDFPFLGHVYVQGYSVGQIRDLFNRELRKMNGDYLIKFSMHLKTDDHILKPNPITEDSEPLSLTSTQQTAIQKAQERARIAAEIIDQTRGTRRRIIKPSE